MSFFEEEEDKNVDQEHFMWVEKYRPKTFEQYLGNTDLKKNVLSYLEQKEIPNMILHSRSPGTGKTSLAKLLASQIDCDLLYINAAEKSGIDDVRIKIKNFAESMGFKSKKVLILDESQRMSIDAQKALLNIIESNSLHTRFIFTCNDIERMDPPLISRLQVFHVQPPDKATVAKHVAGILDKENVSYEVEDFKILMKYYPDIRRIIQTAQQNSVGGKLEISEKQVLDSDSRIKLVETLKSNIQPKDKLKACRQILMDTGLTDFTEYYSYLYDQIDELAPSSTAGLITTIADYQFKDSFAPNKEINFAACIVDILKIL